MCVQDSTMVSTVTSRKACSSEEKDGEVMQRRGKGSRGAECELVDYHSLPSYLKDNEFILDYYRAEWPLKQTILSIFSIHNETLNIWTQELHIPKRPDRFYAIGAFPKFLPIVFPRDICSATNHTDDACALMSVKDDETTLLAPPSVKPIARWPFFAFLCGAMFCLLTSSACHLLSCHSKLYSYIMLRLDYTGISTLIVTSFYPLVYYSFMCHPFFCNLYIGFITVFGVATTLVSLVPIFQTAKYRVARSGLFFVMGVSAFVPIVHKVIIYSYRTEALLTTGCELMMGAFYVVGVVVYATRVLERWMPGKFDIAGHSHQLFHVLVIAGACTHYVGGLVYLRWREMEGCF